MESKFKNFILVFKCGQLNLTNALLGEEAFKRQKCLAEETPTNFSPIG